MTNSQPATTVPRFTLGDRLRKSREHAGMTIVDIATVLGVSEKTIRNYEHEATPMKRHALVSWALVTGVPIVWLEHGVDPSDPDAVTYWECPGGDPPVVLRRTQLAAVA